MSQISPPIRILLVGVLAFFAAWMLFLRPGGEAAAPTSTPAVATDPAVAAGGEAAQTAPGQAVEAANDAAASADARAQDLTGEVAGQPSDTASAGTATGTQLDQAAKPGKIDRKALAKAGLPMPVLRSIADHKVVVLLFQNPKAADDRAVARQLDRVVDYHGSKISKRVMIQTASIKDIARYGQITRGVNVTQSPTLVVIDRKLRADALVGFVDHLTIDQVIRDALRSS